MAIMVQKLINDVPMYARVTGSEDLADGRHYYGFWTEDVAQATKFKTPLAAERTYRAWQSKFHQPLDVLLIETTD